LVSPSVSAECSEEERKRERKRKKGRGRDCVIERRGGGEKKGNTENGLAHSFLFPFFFYFFIFLLSPLSRPRDKISP
jgi:hypothetical protein